jgi:hypothetical protein
MAIPSTNTIMDERPTHALKNPNGKNIFLMLKLKIFIYNKFYKIYLFFILLLNNYNL